MTARLGEQRYGESGIRLLKLTRRGDRHELRDLTVDVVFEGDFEASHTEGDNARILPTQSMRNAVYAFARDHAAGDIEAFAIALTQHFQRENEQLSRVRVRVQEHPWERVAIGGKPHGSAFSFAGVERRTTAVDRSASVLTVEAGLEGLPLIKTRRSAFRGFRRDRFTTLEESTDRLLATELDARWRYGWSEIPFGVQWQQVRQVMLDAFAEHDSRSLQHTLFAMANAAIDQCPPIAEIHLRLPAYHPLLVDLTPFSMENTEVFIPATDPHGVVEATVRREEI
ncbi:MAG: factor-independent urate hydroxylase [Longimicrobiales bacterium]